MHPPRLCHALSEQCGFALLHPTLRFFILRHKERYTTKAAQALVDLVSGQVP
jgi:hypothetical protein